MAMWNPFRKQIKLNKLTSTELAELIVDALVVAAMIKETDVQRSILIVAEEIEMRKLVRDY